MEFPLIQDGITSVGLDTSLLRTVTGLDFTAINNTVETTSEGLFAGFDITEESDFKFDTENGFTPIEGEIKHTGTVIFNTPIGEITVGNFSIGFDGKRQTDNNSGFFVQNTVDGAVPNGAILFDVGGRGELAVEGTKLSLSNTDLFVADEFAQLLLDTGLAADDLTGADVGDAEISAVTEDIVEDVIDTDTELVQDGTTSVALDVDVLAAAAGLTLSGAENTVEPASEDFAVGFDITEESDFKFSTEDGFAPLEGEIEHTGTVTFGSVAGDITVGDFTVGFDAERQSDNTSGFFVQNTVDGAVPDGAILFDVSNPGSLEIADTELNLGSADLLVSSEFAHLLLDTGLAADDLTGADVGDVAINAITEDVVEEDVAEDDVKETGELLVQDGTTSVNLDTDLLEAAAGLTLSEAESTAEPKSEDFAVGFDITEESDFQLKIEDGFEPVGGEIEHTGTVTFGSAAGDITVGDFSVGFDAERQADDISGLYVKNNVEGAVPDDTILFDVSNPGLLSIEETELKLGSADLLVSSEFAQLLLDTGLASDNLTGADVGDVAINAFVKSDF